MTDPEITALAREFAEEMCAHMEDDFIKDEAIKDNELTFKMAVNHLLQRFCLVEKEAVRKEYEPIMDVPEDCNYEELGATWDEWPYLSRFYDEGYKLGQKDTIESLFPEIAKEVGG